jgi:signal transduction histidine kinase
MKSFVDRGELDDDLGESEKLLRHKYTMVEWTNFVSNIDDSAEDAITVLSDLLDFDKVSTGKMNIERDIHDISALVTDTIRPFRVNARSKNILLSYTTLAPVEVENTVTNGDMKLTSSNSMNEKLTKSIVMYGDDVKIQQVIRNLVSNALKFTPSGGSVNITGIRVCVYDYIALPTHLPICIKFCNFSLSYKLYVSLLVLKCVIILSFFLNILLIVINFKLYYICVKSMLA